MQEFTAGRSRLNLSNRRAAAGADPGTHRAFGRDSLGIRSTMSKRQTTIAPMPAQRPFTAQVLIAGSFEASRAAKRLRMTTAASGVARFEHGEEAADGLGLAAERAAGLGAIVPGGDVEVHEAFRVLDEALQE